MKKRNESLVIGTRTSKLARWQTDHVAEQLHNRWTGLAIRIVPYHTTGDARIDVPLPALGGKGAFTAELEAALLDGRIDIAVHSLKDLPVAMPNGLTIGAILPRADAHDVLVARNNWTLETLPAGAVVGTSSLRRAAQLRRLRKDLAIRPIRGNVDTRIRKVMDGEYDATILAAAGVTRLGLTEHVSDLFSLSAMLPAPGQGALAVQCRADDDATLDILRPLHDAATSRAVTAERTFLHALNAGCSAPVAAYAVLGSDDPQGAIVLHGMVASVDGTKLIDIHATDTDATRLGASLAEQALAAGAGEIVESAERETWNGDAIPAR